MSTCCLLLSAEGDRAQIAEVMRGLAVEVHEESDLNRATELLLNCKWSFVALESTILQKTSWGLVRQLQGLCTFPTKFMLICQGYVPVTDGAFRAYGIAGVLPRPLDDPAKMKAILRTCQII